MFGVESVIGDNAPRKNDLDVLLVKEHEDATFVMPKGRNERNPREVLEPEARDQFKMPPRVVRDRMPPVPAVRPEIQVDPAEKEVCKGFKTPQAKIDVGCKWRQNEPNSKPVCRSLHVPSSLMAELERCDPYLFKNIQRRIKETLQGIANDCTWVVVNHEHFARLFCEAKPKAVVIEPRRMRRINPEACAELQTQAPGGVIDVGCSWGSMEMAPKCNSRLTPRGAMALLKECDRNAFENVFRLGLNTVRGQKTECKWTMTPSDSVLVTSRQVLLCPFVTNQQVVKPKKINPDQCSRLQQVVPDGQIPVGCEWNRRNEDDVPRCLSQVTPNFEMRLMKKCDPVAFENLVLRVRAFMRGEKADCSWRTVGSGMQNLFCNVVPERVVLPAEKLPEKSDEAACSELVGKGKIGVGCVSRNGKIKCVSAVTGTSDMVLLKKCDAKTWLAVRDMQAKVAKDPQADPSPCSWESVDGGFQELVCPLNQ